MRELRRLGAVLAADVVGYTRLMGRDESGTLARLREHRGQRFEPALTRHGGRLVKLTGDGALAEFSSAVDALSAAIEFQQAMAAANRGLPADAAIVFRIGLHLGDLIVEDDDLYGDGVNIAARLEAEALPGGIVVSGDLHNAVARRLPATFEDLGGLALKNIDRPVQAFRVRWDPADWSGSMTAEAPTAGTISRAGDPPLTLPDKPSIAVLPFTNLSGDPEQAYFADGVVDDIITALSRFKSLFVIARNSSFSYRGKVADIRHVGRELGVRYVVEGSIRRAANRIRVTAQLVDALTGNHVWAERYDRLLEDIFAVQEEVTQAIVAAIAPQVTSIELAKASRRRPANLTAYEIALRAWAHQLEGRDKADGALIVQSIREAQQALTIDPGSVLALHALARANGSALFLRMASDREQCIRDATWAAARAIELDGTDPLGYALRGIGVMLAGQLDRYGDALADARRAHEMNPNDTFILRIVADLEAGAGEPERAIEHLHQVLRLNPRDARIHTTYSTLAYASFAARQYAEGALWASRAIHDVPAMPQAHGSLVICLVGAGDIDRAKAEFEAGQALAVDYFKSRLEGTWTYARAEDRKRATTFLRIAAGLEEPGVADALR